MEPREVETKDGITWRCVQIFAGVSKNHVEIAKEVLGDPENVIVVCTPSGGAQSVRISLPNTWKEKTSDEELVQAIEQQR